MPRSGGCLCGAVRYAIAGEPLHVDHCHCAMCRRASGAPFVTWMTVRADDFRVTDGQMSEFRSSNHGRRGFCPACGAKLTFRSDELPEEIDVAVASLDDPGAVAVDEQIYARSRVGWLTVDPDVPVREGHGDG